jgi:hypothetical protein
MPASADFYDALEPWQQQQQGCLVPDHDRVCQTCDHRWQAQGRLTVVCGADGGSRSSRTNALARIRAMLLSTYAASGEDQGLLLTEPVEAQHDAIGHLEPRWSMP